MLRFLIVVLILGTAAAHGFAADAPASLQRPNIVMILVDDFGSRDLGCYGSTLYLTPHMDRLALEGARFTQAYVAYPRCVPSRFAILTGKHPAGFQKDRDSVHVEPGRDTTFGQSFQAAGYATFYCGKWHLGDGASAPDKVGFTTIVAAGAAGATRSHFAPYTKSRSGGEGEKDLIVGLDDAPVGEYLTDRLTEETIQFIQGHQAQPFLAVLAHYAVHTPLEAKPHLKKRYVDLLAKNPPPEPFYEPESAGENLLVQNNTTYAAMIESVDHGVGRILNQLERLKLSDRTIVVLASDHGGLSARGNKREVATSNRPLRAGKGHLYEGGLRIPLIVCWPGHTHPDSEIATPVSTLDLYPTFLEMAGIKSAPKNLDGTSLAGLLSSGSPPAPRTFYWHNPAPRPNSTGDEFSSAIRVGDLKLIEFPEQQRVELYDLSRDIGEATNLAESRPADRDRLLTELKTWRKRVGASDQPRKKIK